MRAGRREAAGDCGARGMQKRARLQIGVRAGGGAQERTSNMPCMLVTLEVSKFSGWLNADADCRESNGGHVRCGARYAGRQAGGGGRPRCKQRAGEG